MEGKRTKKKLNTKLHTLMNFSPEKDEPIKDRKEKHKQALKTVHLNMQENPKTDLNPSHSETSNVFHKDDKDFGSNENKLNFPGQSQTAEFAKKSKKIQGQDEFNPMTLDVKHPPAFVTPTKQPGQSSCGSVKKSASKLSLSHKKKLTAISVKSSLEESSMKNISKDATKCNPDTVDQLSKRLEKLLSASSKESKEKPCKKKIKKTQKMYLEQSVMLTDSDGQMSDDSVKSSDFGNCKPSATNKAVEDKELSRHAVQKRTECKQPGKNQSNQQICRKQDTSFDDFKLPEPPKRTEKIYSKQKSKAPAVQKKGSKVVKKKLRTLHEIDFFSSSSDEEVMPKSAVSDSVHSTKENVNISSKTTDMNVTVDMLTARLDSLLKKPGRKGTKKTKKKTDQPNSDHISTGMNLPGDKENQLSESVSSTASGRNRVSSSEDDHVFLGNHDYQAHAVKDVSLQVSMNSSKYSESSLNNSVDSKSSDDMRTPSVSSKDGSFQHPTMDDASDEVSPQPDAKEISLQVSLSQSSTAESNDEPQHDERDSGMSYDPEQVSSSSIDEESNSTERNKQKSDETEKSDNDLIYDQSDKAKSPLQMPPFSGDRKPRETAAEISSCSSSSKHSSNSPDNSIYITPPDAKPSLESTAIGDALDVKFSDLNLHVSRISSESNQSRWSKSPNAANARKMMADDPTAAVPSYVPDSDSDESVASSNRGSRKRSSSDKTNSPQDVPGSPCMNESGPTVISDSEDEDFEKFLSVVKQKPVKAKDVEPRKNSESDQSMDDFIIPDSEVESDEDDSMLHRKVDAGNSSNSINWEDAEEGSVDESDVDDDGDSDFCIAEDKPSSSSSSETEADNDVFKSAVKTPKPKFTFDDSSDEELSPTGIKEKYFTPQVKLKKDRGIAKDLDGALFKTPMYVPKKKFPSSETPNHSPIYPISRGGMTTYPSSVPAKCRTEPKRLEKRPQSDGGTESFLKSLSSDLPSHHRHHDAVKYVSSFKTNRAELTQKLFVLYNNTVFENKMPSNMEVIWNNRLNKTAGRCRSKRDRSAANGRVSKVELSTKVCDSAERVRDTLIHEMCHAAVWLIHGEHGGHGPLWKAFAIKAARTHPELPPISRCHAYDIAYKFTYRCTNCSYQFGRHSKSLDLDRKVCGHCRGRFEVLVNSQTSSGQTTPRPLRTPSKFALFVKENYGSLKKENRDANHKDVMQMLSQKYSRTSLES